MLPKTTIKVEEISGRANNFSKLIKISPRNFMSTNKLGVYTPKIIDKITLIKISCVLYVLSNLTIAHALLLMTNLRSKEFSISPKIWQHNTVNVSGPPHLKFSH
jgi:hypothetical protein